MNRIVKWLKGAAFAAAVFLLVLMCPSEKTQAQAAAPVQGIDVSAYQGTIDWAQVGKSGIKFAMIRVGNVKYGPDANFYYNVNGAVSNGIRAGVYVYSYALTPAEAVQEAQMAISMMQNVMVNFPVAIDMEDSSQKALTAQQQADIVNAFCSTIYAAGYTPMVYSYRNWFIERMAPVSWDHWVAMYDSYCDYPGYTIWQYSSSGSVAGISGRVDMNYLYKDYFTEIPANGFYTNSLGTYYYVNYRKQFGLQTIAGLQYMFQADGRMLTDFTQEDAEGNTIRYCKDGHIVVITKALKDAAVSARAQATAAEQQIPVLQASLTQAQAAETAAQAQAAASQQTYETALANAQQFAALAQAAPTQENLAAAAVAQQQADTAAAQAAADAQTLQTAQANVTAAQTALTQGQTNAVTLDQAADNAEALVVIPE